eukprot:gene12108-13237_t
MSELEEVSVKIASIQEKLEKAESDDFPIDIPGVMVLNNQWIELQKTKNLLLESHFSIKREEERVRLKRDFDEFTREYEEEEEKKSFLSGLSISTVTQTQLSDYLDRMNMNIVQSTFQEEWRLNESLTFLPFEWERNKDYDLVRAIAHLNEQLGKFIPLGLKNYQLYDVHQKKQLLNVNDERYGNIQGGTDILLSVAGYPEHRTNEMLKLAGVMIDLKPNEGFHSPTSQTRAEKVVHYADQAVLELLAGCYHSHQKMLVILTDMIKVAYAYTLSADESLKSFDILEFSELNITQMAWLTRNHLDSYCVPDQRYKITNYNCPDLPRPAAASRLVQAFKRAKKSSVEDISSEHFKELMELTKPGTDERAQVVREFFSPIWSSLCVDNDTQI